MRLIYVDRNVYSVKVADEDSRHAFSRLEFRFYLGPTEANEAPAIYEGAYAAIIRACSESSF